MVSEHMPHEYKHFHAELLAQAQNVCRCSHPVSHVLSILFVLGFVSLPRKLGMYNISLRPENPDSILFVAGGSEVGDRPCALWTLQGGQTGQKINILLASDIRFLHFMGFGRTILKH